MHVKRYRKRRPWVPPPALASKASNPKFREVSSKVKDADNEQRMQIKRPMRLWRYGRSQYVRRAQAGSLDEQHENWPSMPVSMGKNDMIVNHGILEPNQFRLSEVLARQSASSKQRLENSKAIMDAQAIRIAQLEAQNRVLASRMLAEQEAEDANPATHVYHECQRIQNPSQNRTHHDTVQQANSQTPATRKNGLNVNPQNMLSNEATAMQGPPLTFNTMAEIASLRDQLKSSQKLVERLRKKLQKYVSIVAESSPSSDQEHAEAAQVKQLRRENDKLRQELERQHLQRLGQPQGQEPVRRLEEENAKLKKTLRMIFDRYEGTFGQISVQQ